MISHNGIAVPQGTRRWATFDPQDIGPKRFKCEDVAPELRLPLVKTPCRDGRDPETFFRTTATGIAHALELCNSCPLIDVCLERTLRLEHNLPLQYRHGISGGKTPKERYLLQKVKDQNDRSN